jgi:REP element-mobilizing transposase RayT
MLFGRVVDGEMRLNEFGEIVREEWFRSTDIRAEIELFPTEFVVMPNHIHGIVWIVETDDPVVVGAHGHAPLQRDRAPLQRPPRSLGSFIAGFKSVVTKRINILRGMPGARVWQRNYYERIIRDERALNAIRRYIIANPTRWSLDRHNPQSTKTNKR